MPISPLRQIKFSRFHPCLPTRSSKNTNIVKISHLNKLPDELILMIVHHLPNLDVLNFRRVNKHMGGVAQEIIRKRTTKRVQMLSIQTNSVEAEYQEILGIKKPQLDHFSQFLNELSNTQLQELACYNAVPLELQIVGECLVTLKQGSLKSTHQIDKWVEVKKAISRLEFKNWFINLKSNLETLNIENVQLVREIIIRNPSITYERIRDISICGYGLLIVVAASLQYGVISQDLKVKCTEMNILQEKLGRAITFLRFL